MPTRLYEQYKKEIVPTLMKQFGFSSLMQVPRLEKIVLNTGLGEAVNNSKAVQYAEYALTQIAGQKPVVTKSKKSIAAFKLREGLPIGCMVTMRQHRMYEFLERFITIAVPRMRDFRGLPKKGFDGRGNYTVGIREQIIFPEIEIEKLDRIRGMDITFVTTAKNDDEGRALLTEIGIPFRK
jgi:large subunit ribosomal protein L5